jgi:hypothetical protein
MFNNLTLLAWSLIVAFTASCQRMNSLSASFSKMDRFASSMLAEHATISSKDFDPL